ncbi:MAG TPA: NADH-quinone oxidoreductase subunit C [Terracidiphilus sp.]|nr:NADH-quinone oxidoreductase subunit C [Terracidiphilus sp.]
MTETIDIPAKLNELGLSKEWTWDKGAWWITTGESFDLRTTAERLRSLDARFAAITANEQADGAIRLDYQWDLDGIFLSFSTLTANKSAVSIVDIIPGADWAERETYEYFAVEFTGRATLEPLMLRKGDAPGIQLKQKEAAQ